jgi:RNA-binding protein YlmH
MAETRRDVVPPALDDELVDRVVAMLTEASRARVRSLIDGAHVRVAGVVVTKASQRVRAGD